MSFMKSILKYIALYLVCFGVIAAAVYVCIAFFAQKTFYLDRKQWHPAEPETHRSGSLSLGGEGLMSGQDWVDMTPANVCG